MNAYINPKSVTFWVGIIYILKVVAKVGFNVDIPLPDELLGGVGLIGLRKAITQAIEAK